MPEITVRHNSSVSENAVPCFSLEELHVNGARITPVTSHKAKDTTSIIPQGEFQSLYCCRGCSPAEDFRV